MKATSDARSLRFERFEQRLALSGNGGFVMFEGERPELSFDEGGAVTFDFNGAVISVRNGGRNEELFANFRDFFSSTEAANLSVDLSAASKPLSLLGSFGDFDYQQTAAAPETFTNNSEIVPIPPPAVDQLGNEGGQIPMTAFLGPSLFAAPESSELLAAEGRGSSRPASVDATTPEAPAATPAESLRGRAIVYEVAEADQRLDQAAEVRLVSSTGGHAWDNALGQGQSSAAIGNGDFDPALPQFNGMTWEQGADATMAAAAGLRDASNSAPSLPVTGNVARQATAAADVAAAHDAAITALQGGEDGDELAADDGGLAATVDSQQRRIIGGAIFAIAVVPVAKALRRGAQPTEQRPRKRGAGH